jgi:inhibitor of the pro-sigma K processing machinery
MAGSASEIYLQKISGIYSTLPAYIQDRERRQAMSGKIWNVIAGFTVRLVIGMVLIYSVNQYLDMQNIQVHVGLNGISALLSGTLGLPGVGILYGIELYRFL